MQQKLHLGAAENCPPTSARYVPESSKNCTRNAPKLAPELQQKTAPEQPHKLYRGVAKTAPKIKQSCNRIAAENWFPTPSKFVPESSKTCAINAEKTAPKCNGERKVAKAAPEMQQNCYREESFCARTI
jgi:hypothetical protein